MSRREKILVGLMLVAVVYGVYTFFLASPPSENKPGNGQAQKSLKHFVLQIAEKTDSSLPGAQAYILGKAQEKWQPDPLAHITPEKRGESDRRQERLKVKLAYTGFLQMGDKRLAIINGTEYETGDLLEAGGYIVRGIFPDHITLAPRQGNRKPLSIPMEETEP